jgi:hypothetical protein
MIEQENPTNSLVAWPAGNLMLVQPPKPLLQKTCTFHRKAEKLYKKTKIKASTKIGFLAAHTEKPVNVLGWDLFPRGTSPKDPPNSQSSKLTTKDLIYAK